MDGDYQQPLDLRGAAQGARDPQRPLHYLAIPPAVFPVVIDHLAATSTEQDARIVVEKPFGRDLASAHALNRTLLKRFPESSIFRIDHYLGKEAVQNLLYFRFANSFLEPVWNRNYVASVQITMAEKIGVERPRPLLRGDRGDPRRHPEPPAADPRAFSRSSRR